MDEEKVQSRLSDDIERLESRDPIQRLTAVRKVRAFIGTLEETAVAQARSAHIRHSWDEIARVMGTTRWSVLRRFGPHGTHPAADAPAFVEEGTAPVVAEGALGELESLPPELLQKVILLAGELATSSVREGHPISDSPVGIRLQVLPRSIRIELWDSHGAPAATSLAETVGPSAGPSDAGEEDEAPTPMWIELELPIEALVPGIDVES